MFACVRVWVCECGCTFHIIWFSLLFLWVTGSSNERMIEGAESAGLQWRENSHRWKRGSLFHSVGCVPFCSFYEIPFINTDFLRGARAPLQPTEDIPIRAAPQRYPWEALWHSKNKVLRTSYLNLINSNSTAHLSTPSFPTASKQRQWWQGKSFRSSVSGRKSKVKKYEKYYRGPVTKNWPFQLFNKSFCVTGIAPNTPSTKDHNLVGWHFFLCFCAEMSRLDFGEPSMSQVDLIIYHS